ncbi:hypothetical protein MMC30_005084 [Trapelia coarctata]|nr:hypothetical protein [Trapelia coarctata]
MSEPSPDDVTTFVAISGSSQEEAIRLLKEYKTLDAAMNAFYEPPAAVPDHPWNNDTWNEDQFHTDKAAYAPYGPLNQNQSSYTIHHQDALGPAVFGAAGSITRPNSRNSNRALANYPDQTQPRSFAEQDEHNLQKAIGMSLSQRLSGQEVGITDATGTRFGPATEAYYDNDKWAMTSARPHAQEILQNPDPEYRKREPGAPAFIKPSLAGNYIPPLITILHAVPMAREALLARDHLMENYGYNSEWWDGQPIEASRVIDVNNSTEGPIQAELVSELQRQMAFLDQTERAYGNAEALANLEELRRFRLSEVENELLQAWSMGITQLIPNFDLRAIFQNNATLSEDHKTFFSLDLPLSEDLLDCGMTLYEALDDTLWTAHRSANTFLTKVADVLVINAYRQNQRRSGLGIKIPAAWYADRYLQESISATEEMHLGKESVAAEIKEIENVQMDLQSFQKPEGLAKAMDTSGLLNLVKSYFEAVPEDQIAEVPDKPEDLMSLETEPAKTPYSEIAEELQAVMGRVSQKLNDLEHSREQALEKLRELSKLYTKPSENPDEPPYHKYTLRGVSTEPSTTYVLANPMGAEDLMSTDESEWQWWKLQYSRGDARPVSCTKVREVEVLKAARDESRRVLLVYANEKAVSYECKELPHQLLNFVRTDNLSFDGELHKTIPPRQTTPTKRKAAGSFDDAPLQNSQNWGGWQDPMPDEKQLTMGFQPKNKHIVRQAPPSYTRSKPPPTPARPTRSSESTSKPLSYDEMIPTALEAPIGTVDPKSIAYTNIDLLGDHNEGQEMEERGGSLGVVPGGTGAGVGEYALGSYQPEINMKDLEAEDEDEDEEEDMNKKAE